jgi:hypothetical protein
VQQSAEQQTCRACADDANLSPKLLHIDLSRFSGGLSLFRARKAQRFHGRHGKYQEIFLCLPCNFRDFRVLKTFE